MATEFQPYVGPRPFEQDEQALFFGRDAETGDLLSFVIAHEAVLLYAQSGAGKTSLLNARIIPLLEKEGFEVLPPARLRGTRPQDIERADIQNLYVFNTLTSWLKDASEPRSLAQMSLAEFLQEREHPTDTEGLPLPRVVIFDQFEELFTLYPGRWKEREGFFEQLCDALEKDALLRMILVMREDHIAQLDPYAPLLPEKLRTRFRLELMREEAALSAIIGPLKDTERSFAPGAAEKLVENLRKIRVETAAGKSEEVNGEFVEPVQLQVVCQGLWQDLPHDVKLITQEHLQTFGDVNRALSRFYERCIKQASQQSGVTERKLRTWFEDHLITAAGTRGTIYRGPETTGGLTNTAVDMLENRYLIRGERRAGAKWYELTHDRLIGPIQESNKQYKEEQAKKRRAISVQLIGLTLISAVILTIALAIQNQQVSEQALAERAAAIQAAQLAATAATQQEATSVVVRETATQAAQLAATAATRQAASLAAVRETATQAAQLAATVEVTATRQAATSAAVRETATQAAQLAATVEVTATREAQRAATSVVVVAVASEKLTAQQDATAVALVSKAVIFSTDLANCAQPTNLAVDQRGAGRPTRWPTARGARSGAHRPGLPRQTLPQPRSHQDPSVALPSARSRAWPTARPVPASYHVICRHKRSG